MDDASTTKDKKNRRTSRVVRRGSAGTTAGTTTRLMMPRTATASILLILLLAVTYGPSPTLCLDRGGGGRNGEGGGDAAAGGGGGDERTESEAKMSAAALPKPSPNGGLLGRAAARGHPHATRVPKHSIAGDTGKTTAATPEALRKSWQRTLEEIRSLVVEPVPKTERGTVDAKELFGRWKLFLEEQRSGYQGLDVVPPSERQSTTNGEAGPGGSENETGSSAADAAGGIDVGGRGQQRPRKRTRQRYVGATTWERRLQQWADDAREYLREPSKFLDELGSSSSSSGGAGGGGGAYPMSSFGRPPPPPTPVTEGAAGVVVDETVGEVATTTEAAAAATTDATNGDTVGTLATRTTAAAAAAEEPFVTLAPVAPSLEVTFKPRPVVPGEPVVPHTDLSDKSKHVWIVTTAVLPWMTGTAVNPLLRAAYMCAGRPEAGGSVTIMLPWLERKSDQRRVFGAEKAFESQDEQEQYVRTWLRDTADMREAADTLRIRWYTAWQERAENSVYSMGDITALIPDPDEGEADICVLEEPEHLNWYRAPGESWTNKFRHVVGVVHTNYFVYAQEQPAALIRAPAMRLLCSWMCRAHCNRVIKLSGTLQILCPEKELVENVHGVRRTFLDVGEELRGKLTSPRGKADPVFGPEATPTVYFIGKMLWSKGLLSLMDMIKYAEETSGLKIKVDMYGGGPDKDEASARAAELGLDMPFHGPIDHAELGGTHKIFINPSLSEVLCTTVAEALAMGKFVILPSHPSNDFFAQFPNCLPYANKEEFVGNLYYALTHSPEPMTEEYSYALSWEAATERFEAAGSISVEEEEARSTVLSTPEAGVEITLPPIIEDEERRNKIKTTLEKSRSRYRQFRSRLSQEIMESKVLPKELQQRVVSELDKRLDLDLDTVLESPKLRLKLSPAELDKQLLDLYKKVGQGPTGDILRYIGGGTDVGKQNLYMAMRERRARSRLLGDGFAPDMAGTGLPQFMGEDAEDDLPATWVKRALRRNLPQGSIRQKNQGFVPLKSKATNPPPNQRDSTKMCLSNVCPRSRFEQSQGARSVGIPAVSRPLHLSTFSIRPRPVYELLI